MTMSNKYLVILDNGHGQETPGKRSPKWQDGTQLFEWEYTRKLTKAIKTELDKDERFRTVCIVPETKDIGLSARAARANELIGEYGPNKSVFISVHCNAGGGKGWEVFSTTRKNNSDTLAESFVKEFAKIFPDRRMRGHKEQDFTVIYKTNCPAILTENFFMDTEEECKFMLTENCFNRLVELHVQAVKNYFSI